MDYTNQLLVAVTENDVAGVRKAIDTIPPQHRPLAFNHPMLTPNIELGKTLVVTPLGLAAARGEQDIVRLLLEAGADPNFVPEVDRVKYPNPVGPVEAVMISSILNGEDAKMEMLRILFKAGANINHRFTRKSFIGETPLMSAARYGYTRIVAMLLEVGADPSLKIDNIHTVYDYAKINKRKDILKMLGEYKRHQARIDDSMTIPMIKELPITTLKQIDSYLRGPVAPGKKHPFDTADRLLGERGFMLEQPKFIEGNYFSATQGTAVPLTKPPSPKSKSLWNRMTSSKKGGRRRRYTRRGRR